MLNKKFCLSIMVGAMASISLPLTSVQAQNWQAYLQQYFDIVDTFDAYEDWRGAVAKGRAHLDEASYDGPMFNDGTFGMWESYSYWGQSPVGEREWWITNHGPDKQVGLKSVQMLGGPAISVSPEYPGNRTGPSALLTFIGEEGSDDGASGYSEVYIFMRIFISESAFPTQLLDCENGIVSYVEGESYMWLNSWKFLNINSGFNNFRYYHSNAGDPRRPQNAKEEIIDQFSPGGHVFRYGDSETWVHFNRVDGEIKPIATILNSTRRIVGTEPMLFDTLASVEFRFKLSSAPRSNGFSDGVLQGWVYDIDGIATEFIYADDISFRPEIVGDNHKLNRIKIQGNTRVQATGCGDVYYNCGPGMECAYWLDDYIVDDQRIGPKYFMLLDGKPHIEKVVPDTLRGGLKKNKLIGLNFGSAGHLSPSVLELTDHEYYNQASVSISQPITSLSDSLIEFDVNLSGLNQPEGAYYLFFTNGLGLRNETGYPVHVYSKITSVSDTESGKSEHFMLHQNYPNPFNPSTTISYGVPMQNDISLTIYNILGQRVRGLLNKETVMQGTHQVVWDGRDDYGKPVPSGLYLYKLDTGEKVLQRKLLLLK